jgi:hypothetical protein
MKISSTALVLFVASFSASAQSVKAGDLEKLCLSSDESERTTCLFITKAYMDGWIEGVGKGVIGTYKYDPVVLAVVKDEKMVDSLPRITKVMKSSTCIQQVSVTEMMESFTTYVRRNPASRAEHYRKAMTRAIVEKYCDK